MKRRLWLKLIGGFTLLILAGGAVMYGSIQRSTQNRYRQLVREGDRAVARYLASLLADSYRQNGSWEDVDSLLGLRIDAPPGQNRFGERPADGRGRPGGMMGMTGDGPLPMSRRMLPAPRIILTGPGGKVLADSAEVAGAVPEGNVEAFTSTVPKDGVPVRPNGEEIVGYVYVGSMIDPVLDPADRVFLTSVSRSVLWTTIVVVMLTLILGIVLVIHITAPVWEINRAASEIGRGDFSVRLTVKRSDELGELARQFNAMAESLEQASLSRKRMIADIAHELRTPVSLIQGRLEMIIDGIYTADGATLGTLYEETRLLGGLINDLNELADADAGRLSLSFSVIDLKEIVSRAFTGFVPEMEKRGIIPELVLPKERVPVEGDEQRLIQVVNNILSNSLRYTPENGVISAELSVSRKAADEGAEHSRGEVVLSFANNGPSIPEESLDTIFDRFYRLDRSRNRAEGGRGLGLAITKAIVEAHGGSIRAYNRPENEKAGVRFTIRFPVAPNSI